jgi:hypothetical protein
MAEKIKPVSVPNLRNPRHPRLKFLRVAVALVVLASVAWAQQVADPVEAGRVLLEQGVAGLKQVLEKVGAPALTFDQEAQIRNLHDVYRREADRLLEERKTEQEMVRGLLAEQLFIAAAKFLNPVQRDAVGAVLDVGANTDLPSDPDELREYLRDLTSPASQAGGDDDDEGLVIDGFSGGRMPDRDEILEIRINDNAFTSEQSEQGRGRTEIRTRGGAGQFNGDATFEFEDESLNARNAFSSFRPPYQTRDFTANVSGPLIRNRLTTTLGVSNDSSEEGETLQAITPAGLINGAITSPSIERGFTLRNTVQVNDKHALTFSYSYGSERQENGNVGGFNLPEQGSNYRSRQYNLQLQETALLSSKIGHEARFRINGESEDSFPVNSSPHIVVPDAFRGGGSPENLSAWERTLELGNLLMYTGTNISLKTGFDGSYEWESYESRENFNGTFTFGSLEDYVARRPFQYSVNQGDPLVALTQFQTAGFLQSDFRVTPRMTLGLGARYETQTNMSDRNNIDPRLGFAYHFGGSTVMRGGTGIFHQRIRIWNFQDILRLDGNRQRTLIIRNPSYPDPQLSGDLTVRIPSSVRTLGDNLAAPYSWNSEVTLESTLRSGLVLTGSYRFIRGIHLLRGRNINAPRDITSSIPRSCSPGQSDSTCQRPQPDRGNIIQLESTGLSSEHQFRIGFQQRLSFLNVRGNYAVQRSYSDVIDDFLGLPADNYDMTGEWGRYLPGHSFTSNVNLRLPWTVDADLGFNWNSGEPYSLTTGRDDNLDTNTTDRPAGIRRNSLTGPSFFEVDLKFSKTFNLIREDRNDDTGPVAGGGYFGRRRGVRMTMTAEAQNLLNKVNFDRISGVLTSPFFGQPIRSRDGREVSLSMRFNF